jgi:N-methylhydantoinase B/oxoprolinase/acetone carboxylase alpha subunit
MTPGDTATPRHASAPTRAWTAAVLLAASAASAALAGCDTVPSRPANDLATGTDAQSGESGVTVFGTIDTGVGAVRSSR